MLDNAQSEHVVQVENLLKRFPGTIAVRDVSFAIRRGTIHALVGENGAGKSTVIKMLSGVYLPDAGQIQVNGRPVTLSSPHAAQESGISTVHQERNLISSLTAIENIFLGREILSSGRLGRMGMVDRKAMLARVNGLCDDFEFDRRLLQRPIEELDALSRQVVEIIKALAFHSELIILDEPTGGLSESERRSLFRQMQRLRSRGTSLLWVTHHLEELVGMADAVTVLRDGALVDTVNGNEAAPERIVRMMVGRDVDSIEKLVAESKAAGTGRAEGNALEVDNLGSVAGLSGLSLTLKRGEILGLGGLQGAGCNRLVEAIIGATRKTSGTTRLMGRPVRIRRTRDAFKAGIAYVPNERKLRGILPIYTIAQNISISSLDRFSAGGIIRRRKEDEVANGFFRSLRIRANSVHQQIVRLSGGNQQKAMIARALTTEPSVIIFNEPTEGVDVGAKVEIYRLIRDFARNGGAAIVKSSDLMELLGISDRILVMRQGRIAGELPGISASDDRSTATALEERFMSLAASSQE